MIVRTGRVVIRGSARAMSPFYDSDKRSWVPYEVKCMRFSLSSAQVKGTATCLRGSPEALSVSPAIGLVMAQSNTFVGNLLRCQLPGKENPMRNSCQLARELFFQRDRAEPPAVTRSRSRAAFYLTPVRLGHMVGMALDKKQSSLSSDNHDSCRSSSKGVWSRKDIAQVLRATGVEARSTPAGRRADVDGLHTNVSLSRFLRLFELVIHEPTLYGGRSNVDSPMASTTIPLVLRFLWESSNSKQDLLDFLGVVDSYVPILQTSPISKWSSQDIETFLSARLAPLELQNVDQIEEACIRLLEAPRSGAHTNSGADMELVAASLSSAHAFKPSIKMSKHSFQGAPPKPDCVEVVIREIFDLLLFDKDEFRFNPGARLPPTALPAVREYYATYGSINPQKSEFEGNVDLDAIEADRSQRWFEICCGLKGVEYTSSSTNTLQGDLSTITMSSAVKRRINQDRKKTLLNECTASGKILSNGLSETQVELEDPTIDTKDVDNVFDYELVPTLSNVSKVLGVLLFGWRPDGSSDLEFNSLEDVAKAWEAIEWKGDCASVPRLVASDRRSSYRAPLAEETVWREVGTLGLKGEHHYIEFDLERLHNLAVTRHKRSDVQWTKRPRKIALQTWLNHTSAEKVPERHPFAIALQPALLGDNMLKAMATSLDTSAVDKCMFQENLVLGWLASRWGHDRRSLSTLEETDLASCSEGGHLFSSTDNQVRAEELEQAQRALALLVAINSQPGMRNDKELTLFTSDMLKWILPKLGDHDQLQGHLRGSSGEENTAGTKLSISNTIDIGRMVAALPPNIVEPTDLEALPPVLASIVHIASIEDGLVSAARGLGWLDKLTVLYFCLHRAMHQY